MKNLPHVSLHGLKLTNFEQCIFIYQNTLAAPIEVMSSSENPVTHNVAIRNTAAVGSPIIGVSDLVDINLRNLNPAILFFR